MSRYCSMMAFLVLGGGPVFAQEIDERLEFGGWVIETDASHDLVVLERIGARVRAEVYQFDPLETDTAFIVNLTPAEARDQAINHRRLTRRIADVSWIRVDLFEGNDVLLVEEGFDIPLTGQGGLGDDYLQGGAAGDLLFGGPGRDALYGQDGPDMLDGNSDGSEDTLSGGDGKDIFIQTIVHRMVDPNKEPELPEWLRPKVIELLKQKFGENLDISDLSDDELDSVVDFIEDYLPDERLLDPYWVTGEEENIVDFEPGDTVEITEIYEN